jgi:hypothetical protein
MAYLPGLGPGGEPGRRDEHHHAEDHRDADAKENVSA